MVIQSESHAGFNGGYQMHASQYMGSHSQGGYGGHSHGHGGHAPYMSGPLGGVLGGGALRCGPGYSSATSTDRFSLHGGPGGNVQSYTNFESSKYSGGAQPFHGGAGYGSSSYGTSAAYQGGPMGGNRMESSSYSYTNSARSIPPPLQESWSFKSIDD